MQSERTKQKVVENTNEVIAAVERILSVKVPADSPLRMVVWNALDWTALDVEREVRKQIASAS